MTKRGLVIFDLDGTLFHSATATVPAVQHAFQEFGLPRPTPEEILFFIGKPTRDFHDWLRAQCPAEQASQLVESVDRCELEYIAEPGKLFPNVPQVLRQIRAFAGHMAICTNGYPAYVERVIADHHLRQYFDRIRYRGWSSDSKALMVRELMDQLDGRPGVVVGDRREDIEAAHQNGLTSVAAMYGYGAEAELSSADTAVASPSELPDALQALIL